MNLDLYYKSLESTISFEGHSSQVPEQCASLRSLCSSTSIKLAMEIGFNGGHSAELFLKSNKFLNLISFDLGNHDYVSLGKNFIDNSYPFRHRLILGDSRSTVPKFSKENPCVKFDFIFIDGGHDYDIAMADLVNCRRLSTPDTVVILDDTRSTPPIRQWNEGPNKAWGELRAQGQIKELGSEDYPHPPHAAMSRGQSWGHYIFS